MSSTASRRGEWRRLGRWLSDHPRSIGAFLLAVTAAWIVVAIVDGNDNSLLFAIVYGLVGVVNIGRESLRVRSSKELVLPNRLWGARRATSASIACFEVPESVWSIGPSFVVLRSGERVILRGVDRFRALDLAEAVGSEVRLVPDTRS